MKEKRILTQMLVILLFTTIIPLLLGEVTPDSSYVSNPQTLSQITQKKETKHSININGKPIKYKAVVGTIPINENVFSNGKHLVSMSYIAYFKENTKNNNRPISFIYNGGPASASAYLNFYGTGPKIFKMNVPDNNSSSARVHISTNNETWLQFTDEVYIDGPGTGFGSLPKKDDVSQVAGVKQDASCFGKFIYSFLKEYDKFNYPFFIVGESYGGIRTPYLVSFLLENYRLQPTGIVLIAPLLSFYTLPELGTVGNNLPFAAALPTYTLTAYYHKLLNKKMQSIPISNLIKEVEEWAMSDYLSGLNNFQSLSESTREKLLNRISEYTGLGKELILKYNLKLPAPIFAKKLIPGSYLSRYDTRYYQHQSYWQKPSSTDPFENDAAWVGASGINSYLQNKLELQTKTTYKFSNKDLNGSWQWFNTDAPMRSLESLPEMYNTMVQIPDMKIFVTNGYYELGFPYYTATYLLNQLNLPSKINKNLIHKVYWSGHMMYSDDKVRQELFKDISKFYSEQLKEISK